jgi:protein TonB
MAAVNGRSGGGLETAEGDGLQQCLQDAVVHLKKSPHWRSVVGSIGLHAFALGVLQVVVSQKIEVKPYETVKMTVIETAPPEVFEKPKEIKKPKKKAIPPSLNQKPIPQPKEPPKPVQGLNPESLVPGQGTVAVPVGNTLMTADEGKRLKAEDVQQYQQDLTADPVLILSTVQVPEYTAAALDAGLEGSFLLEVFVNADGTVGDIEVKQKIGFGMDDLVIKAMKNARFEPRKNRLGAAQAGWADVKFRLQIP